MEPCKEEATWQFACWHSTDSGKAWNQRPRPPAYFWVSDPSHSFLFTVPSAEKEKA